MRMSAFWPVCLAGWVVLSGCSPYALRGRVVEGSVASVTVVDRKDPRLTLQEPGLADARLDLTLDPDRLNRRAIGSAVSDADGNFVIVPDVAGGGVLVHEVSLAARRAKFLDASGGFRLPGGGKRVLVVLVPGEQRRHDERSLLERTLEEVQPFLRE